jgi:hypothetical protein
MESQTLDEEKEFLPQDYLRMPRGQKAKFRISYCLYFAAIIALFVLTLKDNALHGYNLKTGLVIGSLFPIMTLLYYYQHYLGNPNSNNRNLGRWLFPSIFIQIITIFGFMIVLNSPAHHGYQSQMFTGFYEYGKVFQSYNAVEKELLKNFDNYMGKSEELKIKMQQIMDFYLPFFNEDGLRKSDALIPADREEKTLPEFKKLTRSINAIPFQIAFAYGFLGALIFSLRDGIKRFNNVDMYPKIYVFYAVRFIFSCSLSAALAYFVFDKWMIALGPIVFFTIGYFPERVITFLDDKMNKYLGIRKAAHTPILLSLVQGLSAEKALKLREIGIEDVQNLAVANVDKLRNNLPFNKAMLCDWIAQSILILYFVDDIEKLRKSGVRTILDLEECALISEDDECQVCAGIIGIKPVKLQYVRKILRLEYMRTRMEELRNCLSSEYNRRLQHSNPKSG